MSKFQQRLAASGRVADLDQRRVDQQLRRLDGEIVRLHRQNKDLSRMVSLERAKRQDYQQRLTDAHEIADTFERRYIGICSLFRMVLEQFDHGEIGT